MCGPPYKPGEPPPVHETMMDDPIAVLGAGNGGCTMAADLTLAGHDVHLYEHPRFAEGKEPILEDEAVELTGIGRTGTARLRRATTDLGEAVDEARLVNVVVPAFGHDLFFDELIPHLRDDHVVVVWAGDFGSLRLDHLLNHRGVEADPLVVETNTLPYGTRKTGPATVDLKLVAHRLVAAALPSSRTGEVLEALWSVWPDTVEDGGNVLLTALSNPNPVCHPPGALLNVGAIQDPDEDFHMYRDGISEAVAGVIRDLHGETAELGRALGGSVLEYEDRDFRNPGTIMASAFRAPFDTQTVIGEVRGPNSVESRYITEDLPYGLVPMSDLGDKLRVETPLIDAVVEVGSRVCGTDFRAEGRTLDALGLARATKNEILARVQGKG